MLVIRKKDNHKQIKASGYVGKGGLGEFDSNVFEEIEIDELPEDWEQAVEKPIAKGKDLLNYLIKVVREQSNQEGLKPSGKCIKLNRFENIFTKWKYLDTETGNIWKYLEIEDEFTKAEFDNFVKSLIDSQALNNQNGKKIIIDSVIGLIQQWSSTVRFV
jgi:hypothetical protein